MVGQVIEEFEIKEEVKAKGAVIHCSFSPRDRGDDATTIDRWHKEKGWSGIGYHYVILGNGVIQRGRRRGIAGAHALGFNHYTGICLIGEYDFTQLQFDSLELLLKQLSPLELLAHYEISKKTCPNFDLDKFIRSVRYKTFSKTLDKTEMSKAQSVSAALKAVIKTNNEAKDGFVTKKYSLEPENISKARGITTPPKNKLGSKQRTYKSSSLFSRIKSLVCRFCQ